jgi:hypothetical protein
MSAAADLDALIQRTIDHGTQPALSFDPSTEEWGGRALEAIRNLAETGAELTSDEIYWQVGGPPSPNCVGSVFRQASQANLIRAVGWRESRRVCAHGRAIRVWRSL